MLPLRRLPYDEPLLQALSGMPSLRQLDLGFGSAPPTFFNQCVGEEWLEEEVWRRLPQLKITMAPAAPLPHDWVGGPEERTAGETTVLTTVQSRRICFL